MVVCALKSQGTCSNARSWKPISSFKSKASAAARDNFTKEDVRAHAGWLTSSSFYSVPLASQPSQRSERGWGKVGTEMGDIVTEGEIKGRKKETKRKELTKRKKRK